MTTQTNHNYFKLGNNRIKLMGDTALWVFINDNAIHIGTTTAEHFLRMNGIETTTQLDFEDTFVSAVIKASKMANA